jgi:hypothetical protein
VRGRRRRNEHHHLALGADGERVDRVGQPRAKDRGDVGALEQAAHDDRLGVIGAKNLDETPLGRTRCGFGSPARKWNDPTSTGAHEPDDTLVVRGR